MVNFKYYNTGASFDSTSLQTDDIAFVEDSNSLFTHDKEYKFAEDIKTVNGQSLLGNGNINVITELPSNTAYLSNDSGDGIVASDSIKVVTDENGVKYAPITTPNAIRWPDGSNLNDKLSAFDSVVIEAPVNETDATLPITALSCEVGKYYRLDVPVETLAVTLPEMSDGSTLRGCVIYMTIGTTPNVTFAGAAHGGVTPPVYCQDGFELKSGKTYEVNCVYNGGAWVIAPVRIDTTDVTPVGGGEG